MGLGLRGDTSIMYRRNIHPAKDLLEPLLPAIARLWMVPVVVAWDRDAEVVSMQNIQLSTQGAERQRKDAPNLL